MPPRTAPKSPVVVSDKADIPAPSRPGQLRQSRNSLMRQFDAAHRIIHQLG